MGLEGATVILLAGGFGKRLRHLHPELPKPLIPVAGRPFIDWIGLFWASQGVRRIVVSLGHLADAAERHFHSADCGDVEILTVREDEPLGTGGAVMHAARSHDCGDPFIVANGDSLVFGSMSEAWNLIDPATEPRTQVRGQASEVRGQASEVRGQASEVRGQASRALASHEEKPRQTKQPGGVILARQVPDASRYGSLRTNDQGRLLHFEEKQPGKALINAGVYLLRKSLLDQFPNRTPLSMELDVFPALLQAGVDLRVHPVSGDFLDIGTPRDLRRADRFVEAHRAELEFFNRPVKR